MDFIVISMLKKYVKNSLIGIGAVKGKNCKVKGGASTPITSESGEVIGKRTTWLWTDDNEVDHEAPMDIYYGVKGDKGDKGDTGDRGLTGPQGLQGEPGTAGRSSTIQVGSVSSGVSPSVTNSGTINDAVFNFVLPKGDKGEKGDDGADGQDGKSFDIKGQYPTYSALVAAHPTGTAGEAYFVGTDNNPDLYVWLTDDQVWLNNGKIAGVKGDKGDTGDPGFSPVASVSKEAGISTFVVRDQTGQTSVTILDGAKGDPGVGEPTFYGSKAQWEGLTTEQKLEYTGCVLIDDYDESEYVKSSEIGTAAAKNSTDRVQPNNRDLVESQSVYSAISTALSSIYTPAGDITCAELTSALLIPANVGKVYELSDAGTTTDLFLQGAGKPLVIGDNVGIINAGEGRILFNLMANRIDLSAFQRKDLEQDIEGAHTVEDALETLSTNKQAKTLTSAVEDATTVEGALGALSTNKADKVSSATNGDLASLDANGNLVDSGVVASNVIRRFRVTTSADCNDLVDVYTEYRIGGETTNRPTTDSTAYILRTFITNEASTNYSQIAYEISGASVYRRHHNSSGTWSSWEKLVTESDLTSAVCNFVQINSIADVRALTNNRWYTLSVNTEFAVNGKTVPKLSTAFMYKTSHDTVVSFHSAYPTYGAKIVDVFINTDGTYQAYEYTPTS